MAAVPDAKRYTSYCAAGKLARQGRSEWLLARTAHERAATQFHPLMEAVFHGTFPLPVYVRLLQELFAFQCALDAACEARFPDTAFAALRNPRWLRSARVYADLRFYGSEPGDEELSPAMRKLVARLATASPAQLAAQHFAAVLAALTPGLRSGVAKAQRLRNDDGVRIYGFDGLREAEHVAYFREYTAALDAADMDEAAETEMLAELRLFYQSMMDVLQAICPAELQAAPQGDLADEARLVRTLPSLSLRQLHAHRHHRNRVLVAIAGIVYDVTGAECYAPGGAYAIFAGRDITKCCARLSLNPEDLDDLRFEPRTELEEDTLRAFRDLFAAQYTAVATLAGSIYAAMPLAEAPCRPPTVEHEFARAVSRL